jgi:hypothetical protein
VEELEKEYEGELKGESERARYRLNEAVAVFGFKWYSASFMSAVLWACHRHVSSGTRRQGLSAF